MLLRFAVGNHLSLRDVESLTLTASSLDDDRNGLIVGSGVPQEGVLPATLIYGPNASGKSNIFKAFSIMRNHVVHSHSSGNPGGGVPRVPFALNSESAKAPSRFEIDFLSHGLRYSYGYITDGSSFVEEWLYNFPLGRRQKLFERVGQDISFGRALRGQNRAIQGLTRPNSLFISAAAQNDHEELTKVFDYFKSIHFADQISVAGHLASSEIDAEIDDRIIRFLDLLGTGVSHYRRRELVNSPEATMLAEGLNDLIHKVFKSVPGESKTTVKQPTLIQLGHRSENDGIEYFDLDRESAGTRRLLVLLHHIFSALDKGSLVFIDELDASLHTQAVEALLSLFLNQSTNPNNAQIVATVHDAHLLRTKGLRRDQVWFADKDRSGATHLFSLSDIHTRKGDNIEKGYLDGRYGAVPFSGPVTQWLETLLDEA